MNSYHEQAVPADPIDAYVEGCAYFKTRLVKDGPWVPCCLSLIIDRDQYGDVEGTEFLATIGGVETDWRDPRGWPWRRIAEADYRFMMAEAEWCRVNSSEEPAANPGRPVTQSEVRIV